jgi:hypothetical protein
MALTAASDRHVLGTCCSHVAFGSIPVRPSDGGLSTKISFAVQDASALPQFWFNPLRTWLIFNQQVVRFKLFKKMLKQKQMILTEILAVCGKSADAMLNHLHVCTHFI